MSGPSPTEQPDPVVDVGTATEIARDLTVIENRGVDLVPNIGLIGGDEAVLVVDTGMGPDNADKVVAFANEYARGRRLYLTTTHFHPEHSFGAQSFEGVATWVVNRQQAADLATKGPGYIDMFRGLGGNVAKHLQKVRITTPDVVYDDDHYDLDLGGRTVNLRPTGQGHTKGDQVITVPDADVLFTGDLVETDQFSIFPWFPPHDVDVSGVGWIGVMESLRSRNPATVVPGHGTIGDASRLADVQDYLEWLRDSTWRRQESSLGQDEITEQVTADATALHPDWRGREWIGPGVACLCSEHPSAPAADGSST